MKKIRLTDKIRVLNSGLFIVIGITIVFRSIYLLSGIYLLFPCVVGTGFIGLGIYRLKFVVQYLRDKQ